MTQRPRTLFGRVDRRRPGPAGWPRPGAARTGRGCRLYTKKWVGETLQGANSSGKLPGGEEASQEGLCMWLCCCFCDERVVVAARQCACYAVISYIGGFRRALPPPLQGSLPADYTRFALYSAPLCCGAACGWRRTASAAGRGRCALTRFAKVAVGRQQPAVGSAAAGGGAGDPAAGSSGSAACPRCLRCCRAAIVCIIFTAPPRPGRHLGVFIGAAVKGSRVRALRFAAPVAFANPR